MYKILLATIVSIVLLAIVITVARSLDQFILDQPGNAMEKEAVESDKNLNEQGSLDQNEAAENQHGLEEQEVITQNEATQNRRSAVEQGTVKQNGLSGNQQAMDEEVGTPGNPLPPSPFCSTTMEIPCVMP